LREREKRVVNKRIERIRTKKHCEEEKLIEKKSVNDKAVKYSEPIKVEVD
jgi:hypothetical protein